MKNTNLQGGIHNLVIRTDVGDSTKELQTSKWAAF